MRRDKNLAMLLPRCQDYGARVVFIYRDDYYINKEEWESQYPDKEYPEGIAEIIIAKHRNGPTGQINLRFVPRLSKFENITEPHLLDEGQKND